MSSKKSKNKLLSIYLQKIGIYSTIIGTIIAILFGILTFRLTIKYGENKDQTQKLSNIVDTLTKQNKLLQEQNQNILLECSILRDLYFIERKQFKRITKNDSLEKYYNYKKFYDVFLNFIYSINEVNNDTSFLKQTNYIYREERLVKIYKFLEEGLKNSILIEESICFNEWNQLHLIVKNAIRQSKLENDMTLSKTTKNIYFKMNLSSFINVKDRGNKLISIVIERIIRPNENYQMLKIFNSKNEQ